ncbi:hypothetical protein [Amycolatopsis sp. NPDC051128]|uniref:hypothetical protein n=1 Tax=Amycolatopsis sp. NPDC051128 TaxID=3155412 RepID=UPI0034122DB6
MIEHEQARTAARLANDRKLADDALRTVVGDLDILLGQAEAQLRLSDRGRARQTVKEAVPRFVAISSLAALPLAEVADILNLPATDVSTVTDSLIRHGGLSPAERHDALTGIELLRKQLRQVEITKDHSLLDRIIRFIVKVGVLLGIAAGSALPAALAVGDTIVKEVVKAAITALVALALQRTVRGVLAHGDDLRTTARAAHTALVDELSVITALCDTPAYEGEHTVLRVRLAVRCAIARIATTSVPWNRKQEYWAVLDEITRKLANDPPTTLLHLQRKVRAFTPPPERRPGTGPA